MTDPVSVDLEAIRKRWTRIPGGVAAWMVEVAQADVLTLLSEVTRLTAALEEQTRMREYWSKEHADALVETHVAQRELVAAQQRETRLREALRSVVIYHHNCCHSPHKAWSIDCPEATCVVARVHIDAAARPEVEK